MSTDRSVTEDLMEILQDGKEGFAHAAEQLGDSDRPDLVSKFTGYSAERASMYSELERLAAAYGDDVEEDSSIRSALHRTWMSAKDALTGSNPHSILETAEQGEDEAVETYEEALKKDISADLRTTVQNQLTKIKAVHDEVKNLRNATS